MVFYTKGTAENAWLMCVYNQTSPSLVWEPVNVWEQQVALSAPPLKTATVLSTGIRSAGGGLVIIVEEGKSWPNPQFA